MRLSKIRIENFKSIETIEFFIPRTDSARLGSADFVTIIGENNAGKSSILEALLFALPETDKNKPSTDYFPGKNVENGPITVELTFDCLTAEDQVKHGIRTHVYNNEFKIRKIWPNSGGKFELEAWEPGHEILELNSDSPKLGELRTVSADWDNAISAFQTAQDDKKISETAKLSAKNLSTLREFVLENYLTLATATAPQWNRNPGGFHPIVDSVLPLAIFVPGIKEVATETSTSNASSATQILVAELFSGALAANPAVAAIAQASEEIKSLFEPNSVDPAVSALQEALSSKLQRLIDLSITLAFSPPDLAKDLARSTTLSVLDGTLEVSPLHLGHGAQRALIVTLLELLAEQRRNAAGTQKRPLLLLVEEPEIYMHPYMCRRIRNVLVDLARSGTAQVVCTSHSPVFLDLADRHDGIVLLRKTGQHPIVTQRVDDVFSYSTSNEDRERLRMLLNFDPKVCEVFYTSEVCLVEGDSEIASVRAIANRLIDDGLVDRTKIEARLAKVVLVNCRGKWTIRAFQKVLNAFSVTYRIVHDIDTGMAVTANTEILALLGGDQNRLRTHAPNFEVHVWGKPWIDDKPWRSAANISSTPVSQKLVSFFEFVVGVPIADLKP